MDVKEYFAGKKITLMGLGLLGRGVGDAQFLAEAGAQLVVTDLKSEEQLAASIAQLQHFQNITFHVGGHHMEDFENCDLVIKAAGVPIDSPYIEHAIEHNVPVVMSTALMAKFAADAGATIVGVTGTRGKSTVTQMIYEALTHVYGVKKIHLGGNVRGVSTLAELPHIQKDAIVVLELDSWQLQGFGDLRFSPHVAVFTTFLPDHMNYYGGSMERYFADKANIFLNQSASDSLVVGEQVKPFMQEFGYEQKCHASVVVAGVKDLAPDVHMQIPGEHNRYNAALAHAALTALGLEDSVIKSALEAFGGVPGRLQFLQEVRGVKIYNDNNATTPDATIAALRAFGDTTNIVLIVGGSDKGLDMRELVSEMPKHCKKVLLLAGSGSDRIASDLPGVMMYRSLQEVVFEAMQVAEAGDIVLFSPAFASFGMFANEYDRNDQFVAAVKSAC